MANPPAQPIYLDYAATTPMAPEVIETMSKFYGPDGLFGNPASLHSHGLMAAHAVEHAREAMASLVGCAPEEIIWTASATEATNIALQGILAKCSIPAPHIVTTALEHSATLQTVKTLEATGAKVTYVSPTIDQPVDSKAIMEAVRSNTVVVSVIHVNNETGDIFPDLPRLAAILRQRDILLHVDSAQAASRLPLQEDLAEADLISFSGHKMYGPKGVGVLVIRDRAYNRLGPILHGGGQERGLRPGTVATHQVAGMGTAAALLESQLLVDLEHLEKLMIHFIHSLKSIKGTHINGTSLKAPGIINIHLDGISAESLFVALEGVAISRGSACTSMGIEPSHVLLALGCSPEHSLNSFRVSFGRYTTLAEVNNFLGRLQEATPALRELAA